MDAQSLGANPLVMISGHTFAHSRLPAQERTSTLEKNAADSNET